MKEGILSRKLIFIICSMFLLGCSNNGLESTVSIDQANSVSETGIAISSTEYFENNMFENILDEDFYSQVKSTVNLVDGEEIEFTEWIEDEICYRVAVCRTEEVDGEYKHLSDYIFINNGTTKYIKVTYPSKSEDYDVDRYVYDACDFEVKYEDVTFDGNKDVVISLGHAGSKGTQIACAYVYEDGEFVYKKSFELIPNYVIDEEEKCVRGWLYDPAGYDNNFIYEYIDGQFVNTEEWITYREEQGEDIDETTLSRDELFMAFCNGEINAYEILEDGSFGNININNYQLAGSISDNEIIDMTVYLKNSEPIDLDNDGECEYLLYNPVYGYMCFDCKDGKVICFAHGEGTTAVCSYTWYNGEYWIVHGDTTHEGRCMYKLSKYNGNLDIVSSFEIGWTDWDGDGNASYYMDDMELTKEQYEEYINQIFK